MKPFSYDEVKSTSVGRRFIIDIYRQRQPIAELFRKACKARRRDKLWTQEELDYSSSNARELQNKLNL